MFASLFLCIMRCYCYKCASCIVVGRQIIDALENGVSKYPTLEGRFPQVSGIKFGFDPTKLPGQRIDPRHVKVQASYIELDKVITSFLLSFGFLLPFLVCSCIYKFCSASFKRINLMECSCVLIVICCIDKMIVKKETNLKKCCLQHYRLCTKSYLADGKDGYDVFKSCEQLVRLNTNLSLISLCLF